MPSENARRRAATKKRQGKSASTQAGEYVREEMRHMKEGKHSQRNPKQAVAIGLSMARREGVDVKPPRKGKTSEATRKKAERDYRTGQAAKKKSPAKNSGGRKTAKKSAKKSAR
jgi:hypothetical protein